MNDKFANCYRTFSKTDKAPYNLGELGLVAEVMFGCASRDGGTKGEMAMRWHTLDRRIVPRLECYNDAFAALATFGDVLAALAEVDDKYITPDEFCATLLAHGFEDRTARTRDR